MKSEETRARILRAAIDLVEESGGEASRVPVRKIAERAGVGVGLINHYFISKDRLMEICVQTVVSRVIRAFRPASDEGLAPAARTRRIARQVMDFLMDNPEIARVSILGDLKGPAATDNTMKTVRGLAHSLSGGHPTAEALEKAYFIVSAMQCAFLRRDALKECLGVDFYDKAQRDAWVDRLVGEGLTCGT